MLTSDIEILMNLLIYSHNGFHDKSDVHGHTEVI